MRDVALPSGATLSISTIPFSDAKALYMVVADELKGLKVSFDTDLDVMLLKDIFLTFISSQRIEAALNKCMARATYNSVRISPNTWELEEARSDYLPACWEVAHDAIYPFMKNLYAKFEEAKARVLGSQQSSTQTTTS